LRTVPIEFFSCQGGLAFLAGAAPFFPPFPASLPAPLVPIRAAPQQHGSAPLLRRCLLHAPPLDPKPPAPRAKGADCIPPSPKVNTVPSIPAISPLQIQSVRLLCLISIILLLLAQSVLDLRMGRDDEPVDSMEIDGQQQLKVGGPAASAAVPEGFNADYLRVYYGKAIRSLLN